MVKKKKLSVSKYYNKTDLNIITHATKTDTPVLIVGETGTGKTTLIKQVAEDEKRELVRVSINGQTGTEELLGKYILNDKKEMIWQNGILTDAVMNGKWIVFDEINAAAPEVLFSLHSLLDDEKALVLPEKANEKIVAHEDFKFFATMNPEDYMGTKVMNMAFQSRFLVINIAPLTQTKEINLIHEKTGHDKEVIKNITSVGQELRKMKKKDEISFFCSTRDLEMVNALVMNGTDEIDAFQYAVFNKVTPEDIDEIKGNKHLKEWITDVIDGSISLEEINKLETDITEKMKALDKLKEEAETIKTTTDKMIKSSQDILNQVEKRTKEVSEKEKEIEQKINDGVLEKMKVMIKNQETTKEK